MWIGRYDHLYDIRTILYSLLYRHKYDNGYRYNDYIPGIDKVSNAENNDFAYKVIREREKKGVDTKNNIITLIISYFERFWIVFLVLILYIWSRMGNIFKSKEQQRKDSATNDNYGSDINAKDFVHAAHIDDTFLDNNYISDRENISSMRPHTTLSDKILEVLGPALIPIFLIIGAAQIIVGWIGLNYLIGFWPSLIAGALSFVFRFSLPFIVGSFFGAWKVLGWHWFFSLVFAIPGLLFLVPGLISAFFSNTTRDKR